MSDVIINEESMASLQQGAEDRHDHDDEKSDGEQGMLRPSD